MEMIEVMIKSRVAVGSQIARSRVMNSLRESVGIWNAGLGAGVLVLFNRESAVHADAPEGL